MNGFWSPTTTTWPTIGLARIGSSSAAGATFLPPAVTMISFLRPVIVRKPSSSNAPMSPVLNQSPSNASAVASGLRQYSLNTLMPRTWISPSSARRTPTPGMRGADRADLRLARQVHRRGGGGLGEAVALEDRDAEAVEEVAEPGSERGRARDRVGDVAAHGGAELAVDQPVEQRELDLRAERDLLALLLQPRVLDGGVRGGAEDLALAAGLGLLLGRVVHLLEHARHGEEERGLERAERGQQLLRVGLVPGLDAGVDVEDRDEPREDVRGGDEQQGRRPRGGERPPGSSSVALRTSSTKLLCVSTQPLGRPVEPDV